MRKFGMRLLRWIDRLAMAAASMAIGVALVVNGPAWIYGLRDGAGGNASRPETRGVVGDILDMAKAGWDEAKLPIVVFLMLGIALASQRHRRGHDDAKDEIKGKAIAIVLAIFAFPIAY
jgi:hypothetical protein